MFTYQRELERKGWHRPLALRFGLVILALFVGLYGGFEWSMEQDKGGWEGTVLEDPFTVEEGMILDAEEGTYRAPIEDEVGEVTLVRNEGGEILFEGTSAEEADAWIESQRDRDFTVPTLLLAASAVLLLAGLGPSPRKPEVSTSEPRVEALT